MTKYKCGHETDGVIIIDDNELSLFAYFEWNKNLETKDECWECFNKQFLEKKLK